MEGNPHETGREAQGGLTFPKEANFLEIAIGRKETVMPELRLVRLVKKSSSYEEFFLECMADIEISELLDRITGHWVPPGEHIEKMITVSELYVILKNMAKRGPKVS